MNKKQLEIFKALSENLNFTRTAEQLNHSQTTVTLQIHNLEEELGIKLFERTSRQVRLTPAGQSFYESTVKILDMIDEAVNNAVMTAEGYTGLLEIGFANESNATGISDMIRDYLKLHSATRLQVYGGYPGELLNRLLEDKCDVIFTPEFDMLHSAVLQNYSIGRFGMIAAFHKEHPFSKKKTLKFQDFSGEKFIYVSNPKSELGFTAKFVKQLDQHDIHYNIFARTDNIDSVFLMLDANLAVTVLPSYFGDRFFGNSNIRTLRIDEELGTEEFLATWKEGKMTPELDSFIQYMKAFFSESESKG